MTLAFGSTLIPPCNSDQILLERRIGKEMLQDDFPL